MKWQTSLRYFFVPAFALFIALKIGGYVNSFLTTDAPATSGQVKSIGDASIGGDFRLTDQNGHIVRNTDFAGKLVLVYFGFTHCPDVCPTDLVLVSNVLVVLKQDAKKVQPLFITVDPNRDTPEELKKYLVNFHPDILGLTGTPGEIADIANKYHVFYKKVQNDNLSQYLMDHSSFIYLMGKDGKYITHFSDKQSMQDIADEIRKHF